MISNREVAAKGKHQCQVCDQRFKTKKQLANHKNRKHTSYERIYANVVKKGLKCRFCGRPQMSRAHKRNCEKRCAPRCQLKDKGDIFSDLTSRTSWEEEQQPKPPRKTPLQKIQEAHQHRQEKMKDRISNLPFTRKLRRDATEALKNQEAKKKRQRKLEENKPMQKKKWDAIKA